MDDLVTLRRLVPKGLVSQLESKPGPAMLLSSNYEVVATNQAYRDHYDNEIHLGTSRCYEVSHGYDTPCDDNGESCPLRQATESQKRARVFHVHQSPSGPEHVDVQLTPVVDGDGHTPYFIEEIRVLKTAGAKSDSFVGRSSAFMRVIELIQRASGFDVPVLILGESGTGKELAAKALHAAGPQRDGPFVPVECSGLPDALFESELFGHSRGAFTGADRQHTGLVEAAKQGTLFLDEIGDVPLSMQIKLLRLIESGTYRRVGETERHPLEARIVLATHRKLERGIEEGWFRPDLYYRINAFPIELPPLRERRDDLRLLVEAILSSSSCSKTVDEHAFAWLERHPLPGNVRQLRNLLERAQILADGDSIELEHFTTSPPRVGLEDPIPSKVRRLDEVEREYLRWARDHFRGERSELASKLGLSVRSLYRKLKALEN